MKPALRISIRDRMTSQLAVAVMTVACVSAGSSARAGAANEPAEPENSRPPVVAAAPKIDVQVIEIPESNGNNPLRLKVQSQNSDRNDPAGKPRLRGARLGIALTEVPDAVRAQISSKDLPAGFGVMVQEVMPGSAAADAGLEPFDILLKFADQKLVSSEQLVTLVSSTEASRPLAITLLRRGRRQVVKVRLPEAAGETAATQQPDTKQAPEQERKFPQSTIPGLPAQVQDMLKQLPENGFQFFGGASSPSQANVSVRAATIMTVDAGTITITTNNGDQTVTITDKAGKEIYSGPLNTSEDWETIPEGFRGLLPKP